MLNRRTLMLACATLALSSAWSMRHTLVRPIPMLRSQR